MLLLSRNVLITAIMASVVETSRRALDKPMMAPLDENVLMSGDDGQRGKQQRNT